MAHESPSSSPSRLPAALLSPLGIVLIYALVGGAWIFWSDRLLELLADQPATITRYQNLKGLGYVVVTASLLFLGIRAGQHRLRRAAVARASAEADLRTLLNEASDAILVVDADGRVSLVNRQAEALLGVPDENLVGRPLQDLLEGIDPSRLDSGAAAPAEFMEEHHITRPDGSTVQAELHCARLSDGRFQAIARDITTRRQLEAQLVQAQKMEVVGRMAGGVAHDFNNLLTIIIGSAGSARDQVTPGSPAAQDLDAILEAGARGARITQQLLTFSRRNPRARQEVDIARALDDLVPMAQRLGGRNVTITTDITRRLPGVRLDPALFEQAMLNLVSNARDAMPQGGSITLRAQQARATNGAPSSIEISVSDTGVGMDDATSRRVFEPFFTTKPSGQGTGLGLPMVREFAERFGGQVSVESTLGRGTTVTVRLPVGEAVRGER